MDLTGFCWYCLSGWFYLGGRFWKHLEPWAGSSQILMSLYCGHLEDKNIERTVDEEGLT